MILQQCSFLIPQRLGDILALLFGQHYAFERVVQSDVLVEGTGVLGSYVEVDSQGAEGPPVDGVRVGNAVYFWAGGVDGVVDHVGCFVEEADGTAFHDVTRGVDEEEVFGSEEGPGDAKGIHPEGCWFDWILFACQLLSLVALV